MTIGNSINHKDNDESDDRIAVIGLAGRFPGARTVTEFWDNLEKGLKVERSLPANASNTSLPSFRCDENLCFDANFFGLSPSEAAAMDPQHRVFLETAWQAMEDAGYGNGTGQQLTGIFATAGFNDYVLKHIGPLSYADSAADYFAMLIGNDKDFLASRAAYFLDAKGPVTVVQSTCSSGLLAVHQGMQSLLLGEVDIALTGGASICLDLEEGYYADEGGAMSPTGTVAPFSSLANGIVGGNGAAGVVLKRLEDAQKDNDHIYAIIHASAVNNDGADRASFTSPSVKGQKRVLQQALNLSGLHPSDVTYIEAHGTGTPLGDPIEFEAINHVYGRSDKPCSIGSVKSNIGHLNAISGLAGLIKSIGVMYRGIVPPMQNFIASNPLLPIEKSRFYINKQAEMLDTEQHYAALSSFGFGGTNVHLILGTYQADKVHCREDTEKNQPHLCVLSAKTQLALQKMKQEILSVSSDINLNDCAATLLNGRARFDKRCAFIATSIDHKLTIDSNAAKEVDKPPSKAHQPPIFLFAGQGNQYAGMGQWLYTHRRVYRDIVDQCAQHLQPVLGEDIRLKLFGHVDEDLQPTRYTQLSLFITEYASARMLIDVGVTPAAMLGHSIGEYVAACIAGVFTLQDALSLVNERGRIIEQLSPSAMQLVSLTADALSSYLDNAELSLAVVNKIDRCVVSGSISAIDDFAQLMHTEGVETQALPVSHGFHSHLLEPVLQSFKQVCQSIQYHQPTYPLLSNSSGELADPDALMTADYWVDHLRKTVNFSSNTQYLADHWSEHLCIDLSPGNSMMSLLSSHTSLKVLSFIGAKDDQANCFLQTLGSLWVAGHSAVESLILAEQPWKRVPLPVYPFARDVHVLPKLLAAENTTEQALLHNFPQRDTANADANISYTHCWQAMPIHSLASASIDASISTHTLFFIHKNYDITPTSDTTIIRCGPSFEICADGSIIINPARPEDFSQLLQYLQSLGISTKKDNQVHGYYAWLVDDEEQLFSCKQIAYDGFCRLIQTFIHNDFLQHMTLVTQNLCPIYGDEKGHDEQALAVGLLRTLPMEYQSIKANWLDTDCFPSLTQRQFIDQLVLSSSQQNQQRLAGTFGLRANQYFQQHIAELSIPELQQGELINEAPTVIKAKATYLIVGGMGRLGLMLAKSLAAYQCHIIITGRTIDLALQHAPENHPDLAECLTKGARITLLAKAADNVNDMQAFADDCLEKGVSVTGVFNLAGRYAVQVIQDVSLQEKDTNYMAKVKTTQVLHKTLTPLNPDFLVNFSSLASELPSYGNSDYSACNMYQCLFAQKQALQKTSLFPVISIAWDHWQVGFGDSSFAENEPSNGIFSQQKMLSNTLGLSLLWRIIDKQYPHVVISLQSPEAYKKNLEKYINCIHKDSHKKNISKHTSLESVLEERVNDVGNSYRVAQSPIEKVCLSLFVNTLGVNDLQINDDFLYKGGDSIMAVRLVSRFRKIFQTEISLTDFLNHRTVEKFSQYLEKNPENKRTAQAYMHLRNLSEKERVKLITATI
jgi:phthiocerol/phenolphthiocerol synthesis type-I polyketide synthase E